MSLRRWVLSQCQGTGSSGLQDWTRLKPSPASHHAGFTPPCETGVWPDLGFTRDQFTLYGGTALALRLGHRASVDFDFFSFQAFAPAELLQATPWLAAAERLQVEPNTLTVLHRGEHGPVKVSFFGGLTFARVEEPDETADGVLRVASLPDLFATKLNTIYQRAEARDYLDVHAILASGLTLAQGLAWTKQVHGSEFNTLLPLQALCYFEEPCLRDLPQIIKDDLVSAVQGVA